MTPVEMQKRKNDAEELLAGLKGEKRKESDFERLGISSPIGNS